METSQQPNKREFFCPATSRQRVAAGVVFLVLVASFALLGFSAHYKVTLWPLGCGFKQRTGLPCPTCGMTTSALAFAQGKIFKSFYIQPAAGLLCCTLVVVAFLAFLTAAFGVYFVLLKRLFAEVKVRYMILALIVILAAGWAVTLARALAANN